MVPDAVQGVQGLMGESLSCAHARTHECPPGNGCTACTTLHPTLRTHAAPRMPGPSRIIIRGPRCRFTLVEVYRRPAPKTPAHAPETDAGPDGQADERNERTGRSRATAGESLSFGGDAPSTPALVGPTASLDASSARTVRGFDSSDGDCMHHAPTRSDRESPGQSTGRPELRMAARGNAELAQPVGP